MNSAKIRIAVFGSFYRGYFLLDELLNGPHNNLFKVVGVATDDAQQNFISAHKRVWQYPHSKEEELMVELLALKHGVKVYKGRVKQDAFHEIYECDWRPDCVICGTFGQLIDEKLFRYPKLGFLNTHPCNDDGWPSKYAGPNPFKMMIDDGLAHCRVALHRVEAGLDTGELLAMSPLIAIPPGVGVIDMHKITAPLVAKFAISEIVKIIKVSE